MLLVLIFYLIIPLIQILTCVTAVKGLGIWGGTGELINIISSVTAYHWMLANQIFAVKLNWFQRIIPYDRRIRIHILASAGVAAAVVIHSVYKIFMGYYINPVTLLLSVCVGFLFLTAVLWIPLPGFRKFRRAAVSRMVKKEHQGSYDLFKAVHTGLTFLLSGVILVHVLSSGTFALLPSPARGGYIILFLTGFLTMILSKTGAFTETGTVEEISLKEGIATLTLNGPFNRVRKSGQFAFLRKGRSGFFQREHPFSYLNSGGEELNRFAFRLIGPFTGELARLKKGDPVGIRGGFGNFRPTGDKPVCLIGSGIGIVPLISLLREWDSRERETRVEAFFSVNSRGEIPLYEDLMGIMERNGNMGLHLLVFDEDSRLFDKEYFREHLKSPRDFHYYVCSSPAVRSVVLGILKSLGIGRSRIHYEAFSFG